MDKMEIKAELADIKKKMATASGKAKATLSARYKELMGMVADATDSRPLEGVQDMAEDAAEAVGDATDTRPMEGMQDAMEDPMGAMGDAMDAGMEAAAPVVGTVKNAIGDATDSRPLEPVIDAAEDSGDVVGSISDRIAQLKSQIKAATDPSEIAALKAEYKKLLAKAQSDAGAAVEGVAGSAKKAGASLKDWMKKKL